MEQAVTDFNAIKVDDKDYPKAGVVGEIYVKYNAFSNNHAAQWLMDQGVEVIMPTFLEFFAGGLVHVQQKVKTNIARRRTRPAGTQPTTSADHSPSAPCRHAKTSAGNSVSRAASQHA